MSGAGAARGRAPCQAPGPPHLPEAALLHGAAGLRLPEARGRGGGCAVPRPEAMEEFRRGYARLCAAPQDTVLRRLQAPGRGRLDLAGQSLSLETCGALGRLLPGAAPFAELALGDCGLSEEGGRRARGGFSCRDGAARRGTCPASALPARGLGCAGPPVTRGPPAEGARRV